MPSSPLSTDDQFACLNYLEFLSDLFTCAGKETFTRIEILSILNACANDPELFDPDVVVAQQIAAAAAIQSPENPEE